MSRLRKDIETLALNKKKVKDYDPEDLSDAHDHDSSDDSDKEQTFGDREHYQAVGRSRLREAERQALGPKYDGVAVSRKALASDNDDDPFAANSDEDDDPFAGREDDSASQSDMSAEEEDGSQLSEEETSDKLEELDDADSNAALERESDDDGESDSDQSREDEDESEDDTGTPGARGDLKAFLSKDSKSLAQGLSQAAAADAAKGKAVKKQYQTFDRILDARMKLQKGLAASEELVFQHVTPDFGLEAHEALQAAQESARQVFETISSFRDSISNASTSEPITRKRKRTHDNELKTLWEDLQQLEVEAMPVRRATMDKWSSREKAFDSTLANTRAKQKFQDASTQPDQLSAVLDVYITNEQEKHFRPRRHENEDDDTTPNLQAATFDDSLFYQSLLRDLITTRSATSSASNNLANGGALLPSKLHPSGNRENKKTIDTKASKGRKIRYTVHEKLQNFTAAEGDTGRDTAMWTERGKNEFFGSLFGQDRVLVEDSDDGYIVNGDDGDAEVQALRLFRT